MSVTIYVGSFAEGTVLPDGGAEKVTALPGDLLNGALANILCGDLCQRLGILIRSMNDI